MTNRLDVYEANTAPLIDYYRAKGLLRSIDGNREVDQVFADVRAAAGGLVSRVIVRKSPAEIETMREAGRITARALRAVGEAVRPGITTGELDELAEEEIRGAGAQPAFKGYRGFPATICASPNDVVVHGIPGKNRLGGRHPLGGHRRHRRWLLR